MVREHVYVVLAVLLFPIQNRQRSSVLCLTRAGIKGLHHLKTQQDFWSFYSSEWALGACTHLVWWFWQVFVKNWEKTTCFLAHSSNYQTASSGHGDPYIPVIVRDTFLIADSWVFFAENAWVEASTHEKDHVFPVPQGPGAAVLHQCCCCGLADPSVGLLHGGFPALTVQVKKGGWLNLSFVWGF